MKLWSDGTPLEINQDPPSNHNPHNKSTDGDETNNGDSGSNDCVNYQSDDSSRTNNSDNISNDGN